MRVGDSVRKRQGYKFPGRVVSVFKKLDGQTRVVVECTAAGAEGMLHVFSPENLETRERDASHE